MGNRPKVYPDVANLLCESIQISPEWADLVDVQASPQKSPAVQFGRRQPSRLSRPKRAAGGFRGPSEVKQVGNSGVYQTNDPTGMGTLDKPHSRLLFPGQELGAFASLGPFRGLAQGDP